MVMIEKAYLVPTLEVLVRLIFTIKAHQVTHGDILLLIRSH